MNDENNIPEQGQTNEKAEQERQEKAEETILTRREFTTLLVGAGASVALAALLARPLDNLLTPALREAAEGAGHAEGESPYHWVMVIDLSKCVGCDYCVYACQAINDTRDDMRWNVRVVDETETGELYHLTRPCLHCNEAPCVDVCPVTATYHRADGLVVMDYDKCIGCRYCQTACPYGARSFNWEERTDENPRVPDFGRPEVPRRARGVVEKCTFCIHRIDAALENGLMPGVDTEATPACVNICPVTARFFGDINNPDSEVAQIVANTPTLRLREDLGTEPNVYYIPPEGMVT
jgi:Fe-S-cluster-containing dehydrogenase component